MARRCRLPSPQEVYPGGRSFRRRGPLRGSAPLGLHQPPECRQCLTDDLVHIVVSVSAEFADEDNVVALTSQLFITLVEMLVLRPRNRIIRLSLVAGELVRDACLGMPLPGQMLVFGNPGERNFLRGIVDDSDRLEPFGCEVSRDRTLGCDKAGDQTDGRRTRRSAR